jgi:hypothetical protein
MSSLQSYPREKTVDQDDEEKEQQQPHLQQGATAHHSMGAQPKYLTNHVTVRQVIKRTVSQQKKVEVGISREVFLSWVSFSYSGEVFFGTIFQFV